MKKQVINGILIPTETIPTHQNKVLFLKLSAINIFPND